MHILRITTASAPPRARRPCSCNPTRSSAGRTSARANTWCASSTITRARSILEDLAGSGLTAYAEVCGELLARGHARSGDPLVIAGYLGTATAFAEALGKFGALYADQTEKDWNDLRRSGKAGTLRPSTTAAAAAKKPPIEINAVADKPVSKKKKK